MKNIQIERAQKEVGLVLGKDGETIGEVYFTPYNVCAVVTAHESTETKLIGIDLEGEIPTDNDIKRIWKTTFGQDE